MTCSGETYPNGELTRAPSCSSGGGSVAAGVQRSVERRVRSAEPLHRHAEVVADHRGEPVGLAVEAQRRALELLVVLQLDLEQADHLDSEPRGARDPDDAELVGLENLLDVALGDDVAHRGAAVA